MIDPHNITNFNRNKEELEEFLLFCISVAGKTAEIQAPKVDEFLKSLEGKTPFEKIRNLPSKFYLYVELKDVKLGKYTNLIEGYWNLAHDDPNLEVITTKKLKEYKGIGNKTARFFILHSRKDTKVACLDTHILDWLNETISKKVPQNASKLNNGLYKELEKDFIREAKKRDKHPAHLDLEIWNDRAYTKN